MFLFFFLFGVNLSFAATDWTDVKWQKIMRYKNKKSEIDNKEYFFSIDGKTNPKAEWIASIENLNLKFSGDYNQHAICRFPSRYLYFRRLNLVQNINLDLCTDYISFKNKINLSSVSLIFSSYFINKPASAFGHTLLKLNSKNANSDSDLNSYGVDFSAQVTTNNPLLYGIMGMAGGFYGRFSLLPYFLKLREYNDYESRDLWEFELNFNQEQKDFFIAHLWDMNLALFDYYYFTENCSYHVLNILDVVSDIDLMSEVKGAIVPINTIRPLVKHNLVSKYYFRPSLQKRISQNRHKLTDLEQQSIKNSLAEKKVRLEESQSKESKVKTLDMLMNIVDYKFSEEIFLNKNKSEASSFKHQIQIARSKIDLESKEELKFTPANFDFAHKTSLMAIGGKYGATDSLKLQYRSSLHDVLQPTGDVYGDFTLVMNHLEIFYNSKRDDWYLDRYQFAQVLTLRPWSFIEKKISWEFSVGLLPREEFSVTWNPYIHLGLGPSFQFGKSLWYLFLQAKANNLLDDSTYRQEYFGARIGVVNKWNKFGMQLDYSQLFDQHHHDQKLDLVEARLLYSLCPNRELFYKIDSSKEFHQTNSELGIRILF